MMPESEDDMRTLSLVRSYGQAHRHPNRPALVIHGPYELGGKDVKGAWEGTEPSYRPGGYILFSENGELLYVGKASHAKSIGSRLVRFRYKESEWPTRPAFVRIIEVPDAFEAPSLEEFLISKLQPRFNKHGWIGIGP